jgi:hypothetical protein
MAGRRKGQVHIGTSGWSYEHWLGRFYPEEAKGDSQLKQYARSFRSVEINVDFGVSRKVPGNGPGWPFEKIVPLSRRRSRLRSDPIHLHRNSDRQHALPVCAYSDLLFSLHSSAP